MRASAVQVLTYMCGLYTAFVQSHEQQPFSEANMSAPATFIPGSNNATYGPIPKDEQIFGIESLDIAPTPIVPDQIFFTWLRIEFPRRPTIARAESLSNADLEHATLDITLSAIYEDGSTDEPNTYTIPLRTRAWHEDAHIAIRNATGDHVEFLTIDGPNDILADFEILKQFLYTGQWTFQIVAKLADGTCLFAVTLSQWLDGRMHHYG